MFWHFELVIEFALILTILWRKPGLRWWGALIGVDFAAGVLQILPYRSGLRAHSRLIWEAGLFMAFPLGWLAIIEAGEIISRSRLQWFHLRILAFWLIAQLLCVTLQTQRDLLLFMNYVILAVNAVSFTLWIVLLLFL